MTVYNIPQSMKDRRQWMVASTEKRPMRRGWQDEHHVVFGEKDNPDHWMTFDEALEIGGVNGLRIGYCNDPTDPFTIIDLDNLDNRNPAKKPHDAETLAAQEWLVKQALDNNWYMECSQSGYGAHIVVEGKLSRDTNCGGIEFYGNHGFVVMTGNYAQGRPDPLTFEMKASFESLISAKGNPETTLQYSDDFMTRLNAPFNDFERQEYMRHWDKVFKFNKRYIEMEKGTDLDQFGNALDGRGSERDLDLLQGIYKALKGWQERELTALRMFAYSDRWHIRKRKKHQRYLLQETFPKCVAICQKEETEQQGYKSAADAFKLATLNKPDMQAAGVSAPDMGGMGARLAAPLDVKPKRVFEFRKASEVENDPPIEWAVKNVLPRRGVAAIYGWSAVGKSFLALDLMLHVAEGKPWFKHKTRKMPISYLALEGGDGMRNRLRAYRIGHAGTLPEIDIYKGKFDLSNAEDCAALVAARKAAGVLGGVIVIDTFSKAIGGSEENSNSDMKMVLENAELIGTELDSLVVIVHHSTKPDAKTGIAGGARGAGAIIANTDATIQVVYQPETEPDEKNGGTFTPERRYWTNGGANAKVKEGARTDDQEFILHVQKLNDPDEDGEDRTSCWIDSGDGEVVNSRVAPVMAGAPTYSPAEYASGAAAPEVTRPRSRKQANAAPTGVAERENGSNQQAIRDAIVAVSLDAAGANCGKHGAPDNTHCSPRAEVLEKAVQIRNGPDPKQSKKNIDSAITKMLEVGKLGSKTEGKGIQWLWVKG